MVCYMLIKNICRALLITSIFSTATIDSYGKTEKTTSEKKGFFSKLKKNKSLGLKKGKARLKKAKDIEKEESLKRAQKLETLMHEMADQLVSLATEKTFQPPINLRRIDEFRMLISGWICEIDTLRSRKELYKQQTYAEKTKDMLLAVNSDLDHMNQDRIISELAGHKQIIEMLKPHIDTLRSCSSLLIAKKTLQAMEKEVCKYADSIVAATEDQNIALEDYVGSIGNVYNENGTLKDKWEIYNKNNVATRLMNHQQNIAKAFGIQAAWQQVTELFQGLLNEKSEHSPTKSDASKDESARKIDSGTTHKKKTAAVEDDTSELAEETKKNQTQQKNDTPDDDDNFEPTESDISELPQDDDEEDIEVLNHSEKKTPTKTRTPKESTSTKKKKKKRKAE